MTVRNNKQIWRIARWLHQNVSLLGDFMWPNDAYREGLYDKAVALLKKINNNEFTGEDNHE